MLASLELLTFVLLLMRPSSLPARPYVAYYRVSTQKQGTSGLGLEAQRAAAHAFVADSTTLCGEYIEIESGKKNHRPQLLAAIAAARQAGGVLLIAKLDRLSRNVGFIFTLRDAGIEFVCCDMPDANTLTVGLFAVLAQHERETISKRTKDALTAKKARGAALGTPANLTAEARQYGLAVRQQNAREHQANKQATRVATLLQTQGHNLTQIARELNEAGYLTRRGKTFHLVTVRRLLTRAMMQSSLPIPSSPVNPNEKA